MRVLLYGRKNTTNNRLGKIENILSKEPSYVILNGGGITGLLIGSLIL